MKQTIGLIALISFTLFSACHLARGFKYRKFDPKEVSKAAHLTVKKGESEPFHYAKAAQPPQEDWVQFLDSNLTDSKTYAFLVIRNDSILYERYFDGWQDSQQFPSFSVAKSFVSALCGMAVDEGKIKSLNEPITTYLPELLTSDPRFAKVSIQNVLDMRSGIHFSERYANLFADVWKMGFSTNLNDYVKHLTIEKPAGGAFEYKSINTQLLAMTIERAVGKKISDYLSEKIWQPLGMESDALWHVDSKKGQTIRGFCCLNATARDYAKFGTLYLHKGNWQGKQIISESWVNASTSIDTLVENSFYKNQWWMLEWFPKFKTAEEAEKKRAEWQGTTFKTTQHYVVLPHKMKAFIARGILGQYIYVNPETNVVLVRLGKYWRDKKRGRVVDFMYKVGQKI
jgi:CubicO group peptidase (beta-lactamase class C family)